jgi:ubiquinone/menaquinone biosynthesis C-methylase UbiE
MLSALHKIASFGPVYDLIQTFVGIKFIDRRLARALHAHATYQTVLDLGGGTGRIRSVLSSRCKYFCLDNEEPKLLQCRRRIPDAHAILGDATATPVESGCMDLVICLGVSHHLTDPQLERMLAEAMRVLKPSGYLLFYDALWKPRWWPGRFIWSLDRGSHPRNKDSLVGIIARHTRTIYQEEFHVYHKYFLLIGSKSAAGAESRLDNSRTGFL